MFTALQISYCYFAQTAYFSCSMNSNTVSVVLSERRECGSTDAEKLFFLSQKDILWIFKPNLDKWKLFISHDVKSYLLCRKVSFMYDTALQIKLLLLCPDSLVELSMNSNTVSWFWVKEETVGPQMLKSCFSFHKKTVYEFLNQILTKWKL